MCDEIDRNRRVLSELIRSKDSFTEQELADAYKERQGTYGVDGFRGVIGHVRLLREYGQLGYREGRYIVRSDSTRPRAAA
jgi:hypothetical protein